MFTHVYQIRPRVISNTKGHDCEELQAPRRSHLLQRVLDLNDERDPDVLIRRQSLITALEEI